MIFPSTESNKNLPVITKASGKYCFDKEGKKYLDFIGGNNTVILGHEKYSFENPPRFSGTSYLEIKTNELLSSYTKRKYFRYFKNGTDAVSCAIRLSKHYIGFNNASILFIGYGGSNNEFVSTIKRNCGISQQNATQSYDEDMSYDIIVYESRYREKAHKLKSLIKICDHLKSGILGLDEPTGDIDLYGKSIANGYPVSIITGKSDILEKINEIYYSTTFGGENMGLEAISLTLEKFNKTKKEYLELLSYAKKTLPEWTSLDGSQIKQFSEKGILFNGNWQIMTCHTKSDIDTLKKAIDAIL